MSSAFCLLIAGLPSELALGQAKQPRCTCDFAEPKWQAYGTNASCATFMHKGRTSCEIEFSGLDANPNLVRSVLGIDPREYRSEAFDILSKYLQYLRDDKRDDLADPGFLTIALPILMRGAYLRASPDGPTPDQIKALDGIIVEFIGKFSKDVSDVFLGRKSPFSTEFGDARFEIGKAIS
jgi:hypothetical protein